MWKVLWNGGRFPVPLFGTEDGSSFYLYKAFVLDENGHKYVYKEGENGTLVKQELLVGKTSTESCEILSGVSMSDWIAFPYGKNVKEGAKTKHGTVDQLYTGG